MSYGLQVFDSSGNIILDTTDNTGKLLGTQTLVAGTSGSVTNSAFANGTAYYLAIPQSSSINAYGPILSFNSGTNTLSWTWPNETNADHTLIYGWF